jgi:hypothetical protein
MPWPPTLATLKVDLKLGPDDDRDDERLTLDLTAAVAFVERVRAGAFNFDDTLDSALPEPTADLILGTLRLAGRWDERRKSPDALIQMAEMGAGRVPTVDSDIDRLLGIGRFAPPVFA